MKVFLSGHPVLFFYIKKNFVVNSNNMCIYVFKAVNKKKSVKATILSKWEQLITTMLMYQHPKEYKKNRTTPH